MLLPKMFSHILPTRSVIALMIFTSCLISYMLRVNMSINIIAMVEPNQHAGSSNKSMSECNVQSSSMNKTVEDTDFGVRYEWNSKIQGLILGSYFWGYILTNIPGGLLAERFGPTKTIGVSTLICGALTLLTPICASWHSAAVIVTRFAIGFAGGVLYPALHCLVSRWAPPVEKGKFTGAMLGGALGTVITWPVLGYIIQNIGWVWAFYIPGIATLFWCCLWFLLVSDTPEAHPRISENEKLYIEKAIGTSVNTKVKQLPPYKSIFTSVPFWALTFLHFGNTWGMYLLLTAGPKFMSEVLGFNLAQSGGLAALPYLARFISGFAFGSIGDYIRTKGWLSVTGIRKWFTVFSHFIPGLMLFAQLTIGCDATLAVLFIIFALGSNGSATVTNLQNSQDLAPNFAGSVYGVINCIGGVTGFVTPLITGIITQERSGLAEWHLIFGIGASVYIGCAVVFCIFGSGVEQPWNKCTKEECTESNSDSEKKFPEETKGIDNKAYVAESTGDLSVSMNEKSECTKI